MAASQSFPSERPLHPLIGQARAWLKRFRVPLFLLAAAIFFGGLWWSASELELGLFELDWLYIALLGLIVVPLTFLYGAVNFWVLAKGAGATSNFGLAFKTACIAQFAEILPLPGGAMVRGGALMVQGTSLKRAASHVTVNAVLWVACAALAAGIALGLGNAIALAIAAGGLLGIGLCLAWITRASTLAIALTAFVIRGFGLLLAGLRLFLAFAAISVPLDLIDAVPFAFAAILGSASSLAPGGLGIGEMLGAAMANLTVVTPAAAFLAVGLNRIIGIAISGIATAIFALTGGTVTQSTAEQPQ